MTKYEKYKLVILSIFCVITLIILYKFSEKGRYIFHNDRWGVIDTTNGKVYFGKDGIIKNEK